MRISLFVLVAAAFAAWTSPAAAQCQCGRTCGERVFVGEQLPANARGVAAWQTWTDWANVQIVLEKVEASGDTVVETTVVEDESLVVGDTVLIVPAEPWEEGATYRLSLDADSEAVDDIACGRGTARSLTDQFTVVAPVEGGLGDVPSVVVEDPIRADADWPDGDEECSRTLDTLRTTVDFDLPPGAIDFADMVQWEIEVDGTPALYTMSVCDTFPPGRAPSGDTQGDIAVACSAWQDGYPEDEARQPGTKEVIVTGRLAGTTTVFSTGAVQVDLNCAPLTEPGGDDEGGCSVGSGGNAVWPIGLLLIGFGVWRRRRV